MTNPLTTPSGVPQSTPVPRYPDGSPMPMKQVREVQDKALAQHDAATQEYAQTPHGLLGITLDEE